MGISKVRGNGRSIVWKSGDLRQMIKAWINVHVNVNGFHLKQRDLRENVRAPKAQVDGGSRRRVGNNSHHRAVKVTSEAQSVRIGVEPAMLNHHDEEQLPRGDGHD